MREKDFQNARVGMDFSVNFGDRTYEISAMIYREKGNCEILVDHELKYSGEPVWVWRCFVKDFVLDGHSFLIVIQNCGTWNDGSLFDCFADGISVTDGKTTLAEFRKKLIRFPWARSIKDALHHPISLLFILCGAWMTFFLEVEAETLTDRMIKASVALAKFLVLFIGISLAWDFAQYIGNRSKLLKMLGDQPK